MSVVEGRPRGDGAEGWLERFHAGERVALEDCYRDHFETVTRTVGRVLTGADRETVVHDVFLALIEDEKLRRGFRGGSLSAWLRTLARRRAIDFVRRRQREHTSSEDELAALVERSETRADQERSVERRQAETLVERFRAEKLPARWEPVFEARFLRQMSQREAAVALGMRRTTLAYQEGRIRRLLRRFLLGEAGR